MGSAATTMLGTVAAVMPVAAAAAPDFRNFLRDFVWSVILEFLVILVKIGRMNLLLFACLDSVVFITYLQWRERCPLTAEFSQSLIERAARAQDLVYQIAYASVVQS
jgi:hypothetical protein